MGTMIGLAAKFLLGGIFGTQKRTERGTVLNEAKIIINGERQDQYGDPEDNFALIARLWAAVTGHTFTPHDVAMMMTQLKVARIVTGAGSRDSYRDLCGYAALAADMAEKEHNNATE